MAETKNAHLWAVERPPVPAAAPASSDALDAFKAESELDAAPVGGPAEPDTPVAPGSRSAVGPALKWVAVVALSAGAAAAGMWGYQQRPLAPEPASLTIQTTPPGLTATIAGQPAGVTPLTLSLPAGQYQVALSAPDGRQRELSVALGAGASVVQHVELAAAAPPPAATTGDLRIETATPGQMVMVDGVERGRAPITVGALAAGEHQVVIRAATGNIRRAVTVQPGQTVSLVISSVPATTLTAGWVAFDSPIPLQLRQNGQLIGSTDADRLMLPTGDHDIEISNDALGFRATRRISVAAERTTTHRVEVPSGVVSINALPWAEVWVDGERVGETPIANLSRPIGVHQVVLRHPQFGERRATVTVGVGQTARLGVDMRAR